MRRISDVLYCWHGCHCGIDMEVGFYMEFLTWRMDWFLFFSKIVYLVLLKFPKNGPIDTWTGYLNSK